MVGTVVHSRSSSVSLADMDIVLMDGTVHAVFDFIFFHDLNLYCVSSTCLYSTLLWISNSISCHIPTEECSNTDEFVDNKKSDNSRSFRA